MANKTSLDELATMLVQPYTHLELGQVNDHAVYVVYFKGDYYFHRHTRDEMYLVIGGQVRLEFLNQPSLVLKQHESAVVRAYTTHKPSSAEGALVLMFKPKEMFGAPAEVE